MSQSLSSFTHPRAPILTLPLEITQQTLIYTTPSDVSSVAQTCRAYHEIIYSPKDTHIWKNLFLDIFDDPRIRIYVDRNGLKGVLRLGQQDWRREIGDVEYDWMKELQRRTGAQNLFQSKTRSINATCAHRKEVLKTFISIVQSALPYLPNTQDEELNQESKNGKWLLDLLESKDALNYTVWPSLRRSLFTTMEQYPDKEELSLRNQLHTYLGLMEGDRRPNSHISPSSSPRSPDEPLEGLEETFINHSNLGANLGLSFGVQGSRSALARLPESSISEHLLGPGRNTSVYTAAFGPPKSLRTTARAFVYDLRNYSAFNNWGPFVSDPDVERRSGYIDTRRVTRTIRTAGQFSTNWRHLDALMIVIAWNVAKIDELNDSLWTRLRLVPPMGLDTLRPYGAPGVWGDEERLKVENMSEFGAQDWAGVEGKWRRVVCFCDYHDLMRYNYSTSIYDNTTILDASLFDRTDFSEATRPLTVDLRITSIAESYPSDHYPRINFSGVSDGGSPNESRIEGYVEKMSNGEIHWTWVSIFEGIEKWTSVGIQIGDVGSKAGIIGSWTGVHHMEGDPAGPFWMWKIEAYRTTSHRGSSHASDQLLATPN